MKLMRKISCLLSLCALAGMAHAGPTAYAPNSLFTSIADQDDLVMFDVDNPAGYTVVGPMGVSNIGFGGMDFDGEGNLYAYASFFKSTGGAASGLYRVDTDTGAATPVGISPQSLEDLAFNPSDGTMYGIRSQNSVTRLYRVNLETGQVTQVGQVTSDPPIRQSLGLAFDSEGAMYIHEAENDMIFKGTGLTVAPLHQVPQDTVFSQGITVDWSRDDTGYHVAVGQGEFPNYFSQLNTFDAAGTHYTLGAAFGPNTPGGDGFNYPPVQLGDIAVVAASGCPADLAEPFGVLNFFDLAAYLALFNAQDDAADLNDDGALNFFDVSTYLNLFNAGCP
jgi:hypothetical protein